MNAFVVSDIHGMYDQFERLLEYWNRRDKLVILGDMIDRGRQSFEVVREVMQLAETHDVTVLKGNHEDMFLAYLSDPYSNGELYHMNGGGETIRSFTKDETVWHQCYKTRADVISEKCKGEIAFLEKTKLHDTFGKVLFTHAGFCSWLDDLHQTPDQHFIWVRDHWMHENRTGLVNVFGHTPTQLINTDKNNDVWISKDGSYIGIDGACAYGGQLNGILISEEGQLIETYTVKGGV